jgi:hypothetical protein
MAFWRMLKQGNDIFEVTRHEPKVDVCDKHYVFNAVSPSGGTPNFSPRAACPAYQLDKEIAAAIKQKQAEDERKMADHAQRGVSTVSVRTGSDGGMHPTFLARLRHKTPWDSFAQQKVVGAQPGDMGNNVNPPHGALDDDSASAQVQVASSPMNESGSGESTWERFKRAFSPQTAEAAPQQETQAAPVPTPKPRVARKSTSSTTTVAQNDKPAAAKPQKTASDSKPQQIAEAPASRSDGASAVISGAQAPVQSSSFESRWSSR